MSFVIVLLQRKPQQTEGTVMSAVWPSVKSLRSSTRYEGGKIPWEHENIRRWQNLNFPVMRNWLWGRTWHFFLSEQQAAYALKIIAASSDVAVSLRLWALSVGTGRLIRLRRLHRRIPQHFIFGWRSCSAWARWRRRQRENSPPSCSIRRFPREHMKGQLSITTRRHATPVKRWEVEVSNRRRILSKSSFRKQFDQELNWRNRLGISQGTLSLRGLLF